MNQKKLNQNRLMNRKNERVRTQLDLSSGKQQQEEKEDLHAHTHIHTRIQTGACSFTPVMRFPSADVVLKPLNPNFQIQTIVYKFIHSSFN